MGGKSTLCWDCAKAIGGCEWSNCLEPVPGWEAIPTHRNVTRDYSLDESMKQGYIVVKCPLFERDAYEHGVERVARSKNPQPRSIHELNDMLESGKIKYSDYHKHYQRIWRQKRPYKLKGGVDEAYLLHRDNT